jgi:hypothetical protein
MLPDAPSYKQDLSCIGAAMLPHGFRRCLSPLGYAGTSMPWGELCILLTLLYLVRLH